MRRQALQLAPLLVALALLTSCAQLGIGMDTKPEGAKQRFAAAMVDYEIVSSELTVLIEGWTIAVEQGDPLVLKYVAAARRIDLIRARARLTIEIGIAALAKDPIPKSDLEMATRVLSAVITDLQRELLTAGGA